MTGDNLDRHRSSWHSVINMEQVDSLGGHLPYCQQLECPHSSLPFFASGGWNFLFWDYFRLVTRYIVHTCARCSYTMSSAHIIGPKWQRWSGWHLSCLAVWDNFQLCYIRLVWVVPAISQHGTVYSSFSTSPNCVLFKWLCVLMDHLSPFKASQATSESRGQLD